MVLRHTKNGLSWLTFNLFDPHSDITHASFLRQGDLTFANCTSDVLAENERRARSALDLPHTFVMMHQVHGKEISLITEKNRHDKFTCDALITNEKNCPLAVRHADCQAALFFDPIQKAIGAAHAGWRGSCLNIYEAVIEKMILHFNSHPKDILAVISPSLGPEKAEFINYEREIPAELWPYRVKQFYFDFWKISRDQLISAGLSEKHIEIARLCTHSNPEDYFSYRRDKTEKRHLTFISLR